MRFTPIWFDSLGAKSSCTLVETPDVGILIDPGIAAMQPSFPASREEKLRLRELGRRAILSAAERCSLVVISHYHRDHYFAREIELYENKLLLAKNPNEYINDSQRSRAEDFYSRLCEHFGRAKLEALLEQRRHRDYADPLESLPTALRRDFGDYNRRRRELFELGREWFRRRVERWKGTKLIPQLKFEKLEVRYPEGRELRFGDTKLRFSPPLFHGVEFSRVGWVFATVVEHSGEKLLHSSDLNGPIIEDYAEWIIQENPDILILDGPMTYMLGYLLNRHNLRRAVDNAVRIVKETETKLIIYDHHLARERRFREHTSEVWKTARRLNKRVLTAAEFLGKPVKVLEGGKV